MEFGSDYFLVDAEDDNEEIAEEELNQGVMYSAQQQDFNSPVAMLNPTTASNNNAPNLNVHPNFSPATTYPSPLPSAQAPKKRIEKADTNVLSVSLGTLGGLGVVCTGDPVLCAKCKAVFSTLSVLKSGSASNTNNNNNVANQIWECEFCQHRNSVALEPEEMPKGDTLDYIIEPASVKVDGDEGVVVFCIDTSGSMCVTTELQGRVQLRGEQQRRAQFSSLGSDVPHFNNNNVTYISRLQCVQAAVDHQLRQIAQSHPNKRIALVAFNTEVQVLGDGSKTEVIVTGDKLNNYEQLWTTGSEVAAPGPIKDSLNVISKKVYDLQEGGQTALGPALLVSLAIAHKYPGSQVILCTDGLSNVGIGALELNHQNTLEEAQKFYRKIANVGLESGVSVSVTSIRGTQANLQVLGNMADETKGQVELVDPETITTKFGNILANPTIAVGVEVDLVLHKGLSARGLLGEDLGCHVHKVIGNAMQDTDVSFQYSIKSKDSAEWKELGKLPFQVVIRYTRMDGTKCLRTISKLQTLTTDRAQAEAHAQIPVIASHALQNSASLAATGHHEHARMKMVSNQRMLFRGHQVQQQVQQQQVQQQMHQPFMQQQMQQQQQMQNFQQQQQYTSFVQDAESLDLNLRRESACTNNRQNALTIGFDDNTASSIYSAKRSTTSKYKSPSPMGLSPAVQMPTLPPPASNPFALRPPTSPASKPSASPSVKPPLSSVVKLPATPLVKLPAPPSGKLPVSPVRPPVSPPTEPFAALTIPSIQTLLTTNTSTNANATVNNNNDNDNEKKRKHE